RAGRADWRLVGAKPGADRRGRSVRAGVARAGGGLAGTVAGTGCRTHDRVDRFSSCSSARERRDERSRSSRSGPPRKMSMNSELTEQQAFLVLNALPNIGPITLNRVLEELGGDPRAVL